MIVTVAFLFQGLHSSGFVLQFSCAAIAVRDRFKMIHNKLLAKKSLNADEVGEIIEIYEKLFKCIKMINKYLTLQLIPLLAIALTNFTLSIYTVVRAFLNNSPMKIVYVPTNCLWEVSESCLLTFLVHSSTSTSSVAEKTKTVGYKILQDFRFSDERSREKFERFIKSITKSSYELKSAIFVVDWNLLFSVSLIKV